MNVMANAWWDEIDEKESECQESPEAAKYLYVVAGLEAKKAEISRVAQSQLDAVAEWEKAEREKLQRQISWLSSGLEGYIRATGEKTISLPNGKLKLRAQQAKMEIDEEVFFEEGPPEKWVRLVAPVPAWRAPDKKAIRADIPAMLKKDGELPAGVTWAEQEAKFSYDVSV